MLQQIFNFNSQSSDFLHISASNRCLSTKVSWTDIKGGALKRGRNGADVSLCRQGFQMERPAATGALPKSEPRYARMGACAYTPRNKLGHRGTSPLPYKHIYIFHRVTYTYSPPYRCHKPPRLPRINKIMGVYSQITHLPGKPRVSAFSLYERETRNQLMTTTHKPMQPEILWLGPRGRGGKA